MAQTMPGPFQVSRGTCLTAAWVAEIAAAYQIDPSARDALLRHTFPYLRPALKRPRFKIEDARQLGAFDPTSPTCPPPTGLVRGVGERVFADGRQAVRGTIVGTITLELNSWLSHALSTTILSILLQEVVGYDVSIFQASDPINTAERMSSVGQGLCYPTHANVEVWTAGKATVLSNFANETIATTIGYSGQSGLYTLKTNVDTALLGNTTGLPFARSYSADFWREFMQSDDLINFFSIQNTLDLHQLAQSSVCPDGTFGCRNGCSKNDACTAAEAANRTCILVAMMDPQHDPGYFEAVVSNNRIPAYFCYGGMNGLSDYIINTMNANGTLIFYGFQPDLIQFIFKGDFARIAFPRGDSVKASTSTNSFGENGYGQPTTNPVDVDFPSTPLTKYYMADFVSDPFVGKLLSKMKLTQLDMNNLLTYYASNMDNPTLVDPVFATACNWVRQNVMTTWRTWIPRLMLCTVDDHLNYTVTGCNETTRVITFAWVTPDPDDVTQPYACDGGVVTLPRPMMTSRSCPWLVDNFDTWKVWLTTKPPCERCHYNYSITDCTDASTRDVGFFWFQPQPHDRNASSECVGGVLLPPNVTVACDYVPFSAPAYGGMAAFAVFVMVLIGCSMWLVVAFRGRTVIKRAQWPLLMLILVGGLIMCAFVLAFPGRPTPTLCAVRPLLASLAFAVPFAAILVKSLRVYLLFSNKQMKKVTVSLGKMLKLYGVLVGIDTAVVGVGLAVDFPHPSISIANATEFVGTVDHLTCRTSSFIFTALSMFFKALVLFGGLYVAVMIRHADADFQETIWIVAAAAVVVLGALFLIPLVYFVKLDPVTAFTVRSTVLLIGTLMVVGLMIGPKFYRLRTATKSTETKSTPTNASSAAPVTNSKATNDRASSQVSDELHQTEGLMPVNE
ncbi:Aste57867_17034 [Aphanomyces stellatus]|uniref:Aste57867_17034 protein n=1 Tax=Aphanomyces stellatus TaxID=120398 RepID=A0A485L6U5_9STRA|nr:hypothetical protein As57867_016976 [Aphanomyces stellatus]VFT93795.1 Aste57867_17034 [Aphanomyces stellatus]